MEILWNTEIVNRSEEIIYAEYNKPNLIMNYAAALYLHRLEQPASPSDFDLLKFVALGSSNANPTSPTIETMGTDEITRILIGSNFRYESDNGDNNVLVVEYSYDNTTAADIIINERGLIAGGMEYTDAGWTGDWSDRSQTGYLFSRMVEINPIVVPVGGTIYGSVKITTDIF